MKARYIDNDGFVRSLDEDTKKISKFLKGSYAGKSRIDGHGIIILDADIYKGFATKTNERLEKYKNFFKIEYVSTLEDIDIETIVIKILEIKYEFIKQLYRSEKLKRILK